MNDNADTYLLDNRAEIKRLMTRPQHSASNSTASAPALSSAGSGIVREHKPGCTMGSAPLPPDENVPVSDLRLQNQKLRLDAIQMQARLDALEEQLASEQDKACSAMQEQERLAGELDVLRTVKSDRMGIQGRLSSMADTLAGTHKELIGAMQQRNALKQLLKATLQAASRFYHAAAGGRWAESCIPPQSVQAQCLRVLYPVHIGMVSKRLLRMRCSAVKSNRALFSFCLPLCWELDTARSSQAPTQEIGSPASSVTSISGCLQAEHTAAADAAIDGVARGL